MSSLQQRNELQATIWKIADEVRGAVDGWDFKQFVLGTLFYRFLSENFVHHIRSCYGDDYTLMQDEEVEPFKHNLTCEKGYFIFPSQLFANVVRGAETNADLNTDLARIFANIEASAVGYASEEDIKGLFADFDTTSNRLGNTVEEKNRRLTAVLKGIESLNFGQVESNDIDLFGDAYEFLISNYASNAGKSGGEFFTPQNVSKLLARLALHGLHRVHKVYDPACGSGSLLLQAKKQLSGRSEKVEFFGQEINHTTYNLARMNMFLHNISYNNFDIALGDTLLQPRHLTQKPFDVIVSNPPYSVKWVGADNPLLIADERFAPAGVLAPKGKADFAFVLHSLHHLSASGRAAIVCFPGIFYRSGAEQKIRNYLVSENLIEAVIALPPNLFFGTSIAVNLLLLSKHKTDYSTLFIDASGEDFFRKETNNNVLTDEHIEAILSLYADHKDVPHRVAIVENERIAENDFNLSVSAYVEAEDKREQIDIRQLNAEVEQTVKRINELRADINAIIAELDAE